MNLSLLKRILAEGLSEIRQSIHTLENSGVHPPLLSKKDVAATFYTNGRRLVLGLNHILQTFKRSVIFSLFNLVLVLKPSVGVVPHLVSYSSSNYQLAHEKQICFRLFSNAFKFK